MHFATGQDSGWIASQASVPVRSWLATRSASLPQQSAWFCLPALGVAATLWIGRNDLPCIIIGLAICATIWPIARTTIWPILGPILHAPWGASLKRVSQTPLLEVAPRSRSSESFSTPLQRASFQRLHPGVSRAFPGVFPCAGLGMAPSLASCRWLVWLATASAKCLSGRPAHCSS